MSARLLLTPQAAVLLVTAAIGWAVIVAWANLGGPMAGTIGVALPTFLVSWTVMMAAMMLPSVAPVAAALSRSTARHRAQRLALFAVGYISIWASAGVLAFAVSALMAGPAEMDPSVGAAVVIGAFVACGLYQLTPFKQRFLTRCRSAEGPSVESDWDDSSLGDIRLGLQNGANCLGSSWSLMVVLVALGTMSFAPMLILSAIVFIEKLWSGGATFSRLVGIASLVLAAATFSIPDLAAAIRPSM